MLAMLQMGLLPLLARFRENEDGAALVEYGMLVGLIAVICILAVTGLGDQISEAFSYISSSLAAKMTL